MERPEPPQRRKGHPHQGQGETAFSADLEIYVDIVSVDGREHLRYTLDSGKVSYTRRRILGPSFEMAPQKYQADLFESLERLADGLASDGSTLVGEEILSELEKLGQELYRDLFTPEMKEAYREFRSEVKTLHIISHESWIPWELVRPYDDSNLDAVIEDDFWCMQFQVTRWLSGDTAPAGMIDIPRLAVIESGAPPGVKKLDHAKKELGFLAKLAKRRGVEDRSLPSATFERLEQRLREDDLGLVHFVGHGKLIPGQPNQASFLLEDGRAWRPRDLLKKVGTRLRRNRPLVFLNACQMGQPGWARTRLGGWAPNWIEEAGCGAFLGPQWTVDDELAYEFAKTFYQELEGGKTFAVATQTARRRLRELSPENPAWLAYTVYAHPTGRLNTIDVNKDLIPKYRAPANPTSPNDRVSTTEGAGEEKRTADNDRSEFMKMARYSRIKHREPISRLCQVLYHAAPSPLTGLIIIFLLVATFSGILNMLYRAHVSPGSKERLARIRELSQELTFKEGGKIKIKDGAVDRIMSNETERQLIIPRKVQIYFLMFNTIFRSGVSEKSSDSSTGEAQDAPRNSGATQELQRSITEAALIEYAQRGEGLIDTLLLYRYIDPGMFIDKTILRPLIVTLLFQLIVVATRMLEALQNPVTSVLQDPHKFDPYGAKIFRRIILTKKASYAAILTAIALAVEEYYSYGVSHDREISRWAVRLMNSGYIIIYLVVILTIILSCLDVEGIIRRSTRRRAWKVHKSLGCAALLSIAAGIFLHGPTTWADEDRVEMMHEMFHYNRFERFVIDYYTIYGLMIAVSLVYIFSLIPVKFSLEPRFKKKEEHRLFGFELFIDFAGIVILTSFMVILVIWVQSRQMQESGDIRETMYVFYLKFFTIGVFAIAIALVFLLCTISRSKKRAIRGLRESWEKLQVSTRPRVGDSEMSDDANIEKIAEIERQLENAEWFTLQRIVVEIFKRRMMFLATFLTFLFMATYFMQRELWL